MTSSSVISLKSYYSRDLQPQTDLNLQLASSDRCFYLLYVFGSKFLKYPVSLYEVEIDYLLENGLQN